MGNGVNVEGVPIEEATARDHIQVRAKLVKRLKGANNALVWARIYYRADEDSRAAEESEGEWWWQASYGLIATETGLTEKQARDAVDALVAGGWIARSPGKGRAFLYRPIVARKTHLPSGADTESDPQGRYIGPEGQIHLPAEALTPLIDLEDKTDTPVVPTEASPEQLFAEAWKAWPRSESKKSAEKKFLAVKDPRAVAAAIVAHGRAYRDGGYGQFTPYLATWLNQARWDEPLPPARAGAKTGTVDAGRQADAILRAREGDRQAIAS